MFMGESHPGTLHGEQVGVATLLVSEIQNDITNNFKTQNLALFKLIKILNICFQLMICHLKCLSSLKINIFLKN